MHVIARRRLDFGHSSTLSSATRVLQAQTIFSQPGEEAEQEADRLSEQAMRLPARLPRHRNGRQPLSDVEAGAWTRVSVLPLVGGALRSPGQALEPDTRASMESRFGRDFSRVRVHADAQAAASAQAVSALAYTSGHHIVFASGQYRPATQSGMRLLAHELAHTLQRGDPVVYRKFDFTQPKPRLFDPIPLALSGNILGKTYPGLNGKLLPKTAIKKEYLEQIFKALQPLTYNFSRSEDSITCKVDPKNYNITVFADVEAITKPQGGKWSGTYTPDRLKNLPSECTQSREKTIPVEMRGKPDSDALYEKVLAHEQEHVKDLENLSTKKFKKFHDFLLGLSGAGKSEEECVNDLFKKVGDKDTLATREFVDEWLDAVQVYDKPGGSHHSKFVTKVGAECKDIKITEKL